MMLNLMRFLLALMLMSGVAAAATVDELISDLDGTDEVARAQARQLLPREGLPAAEKVLPLISSDDPNIWWAARNVLADIGSELSALGRDAERAKLAGLYMRLVAPDQSEAVKIRGLDLLMPVVPPSYEVGPIAALLEDQALRERARAALEGIGSTQACAAMSRALQKADPEFQCALLNSLGRCQDGLSLPQVLAQTRSDDPRVRTAAARAVAWTGDPTVANELRRVRQDADEATRFEATDALLRLADAMAQSGKTSEAQAVYAEVMNDPNPVLAGGGLAGLVRHGDETVAEQVADALSGEKRAALEPAALAALESLRGDTGNALILAVYSATAPDLRAGLLRIMGRKRDAAFLDTLKRAASEKNEGLQQAAVEALADSRVPGAAAVLGEKKASAALQRMAEQCRNDGNQDIAGEAFVALYQSAEAPETKKLALDNLLRNPVPEATDIVLAAIDQGELTDADGATLSALARVLSLAGRTEEAGRVAGAWASRASTTEAVQGTIEAAKAAGGVPGLASKLGFVTAWKVTGPFAWTPGEGFGSARVNEPGIDLNATYTDGGKQFGWTDQRGDDLMGIVDLGGALGAAGNATAYAFARVNVPADTDAVIRAGSDDGIRIWLNGQPVHENLVDRGTALDSDQVPAKLKAGANDLLVQITQGGGGWNFCLRLTHPDGKPLQFTQE